MTDTPDLSAEDEAFNEQQAIYRQADEQCAFHPTKPLEHWQAERKEIYAAHAQLIANQRAYHEAELDALRAQLQAAEADRDFERQRCATLAKTADDLRSRLAEVEAERDEELAHHSETLDRLDAAVAETTTLRASICKLADRWFSAALKACEDINHSGCPDCIGVDFSNELRSLLGDRKDESDD